jgi:hypothetical protein
VLRYPSDLGTRWEPFVLPYDSCRKILEGLICAASSAAINFVELILIERGLAVLLILACKSREQ